MKLVQILFWLLMTILAAVVEEFLRICLFPIGIFTTIILSIFGQKDTIDNSYFLNYCSPWKMNEYYFPIASNVSDWLDPRIK